MADSGTLLLSGRTVGLVHIDAGGQRAEFPLERAPSQILFHPSGEAAIIGPGFACLLRVRQPAP